MSIGLGIVNERVLQVSSAELERVCDQVCRLLASDSKSSLTQRLQVPGVKETAAIAVPPPDGGPDQLVLYCVLKEPAGCPHTALQLDDCGWCRADRGPLRVKESLAECH